MYGQCMGNVWEIYGQCKGNIWAIFGKFMGNVRAIMYRQCTGNIWAMYEQCMSNVWAIFGQCMSNVWAMYEKCMGNIRKAPQNQIAITCSKVIVSGKGCIIVKNMKILHILLPYMTRLETRLLEAINDPRKFSHKDSGIPTKWLYFSSSRDKPAVSNIRNLRLNGSMTSSLSVISI